MRRISRAVRFIFALAGLLLSAQLGSVLAQPSAGGPAGQAQTTPAPVTSPLPSIAFIFDADARKTAPLNWFAPLETFSLTRAGEKLADSGNPTLYLQARDAGTDQAEAGGASPAFGNAMLSLPAKGDGYDLRGKRITFSARVKVVEPAARAQLWLRIDRPNDEVGAFDNMADRPLLPKAEFSPLRITATVDADAVAINVGCMLFGPAGKAAGGVLISSPMLQSATGKQGDGDISARALSATGRQNVLAAGRFVASVRAFCPASAPSELDAQTWDRVMMLAIERAEPCETVQQLQACLTDLGLLLGTPALVWDRAASRAGPSSPSGPSSESKPSSHVAGWRHYGVNWGSNPSAQTGSIYSSRRIIEATATPVERSRLAKPGSFAVVDLARGLATQINVRLPADGSGVARAGPTFDAAAEKDRAARLATALDALRPSDWLATGNDRTIRLAAVLWTVTIADFFYPYWDGTPATPENWGLATDEALTSAAQAKDRIEQLTILRRLVARLRDGHGGVYQPAIEPTTVMPLPLIWAKADDGTKRVAIARKLSLRPESLIGGDVLVSVDGRSIDDLVAELRPQISGATPGWIDHQILQMLTRLPTAERRVEITVKRGGEVVRTKVTRESADEPSVASKLRPYLRPANGEDIADRIGSGSERIMYFDLDGADANTLADSIEALAQADAVVFDMRGYPGDSGVNLLGHLVRRASRSLSMAVPVTLLPPTKANQSPLGTTAQEFTSVAQWEIKPRQPRLKGKVVFIISGQAISYAESCMSIVESLKLGTFVGEPTAGTNGNINTVPLPGGYLFSFTGMRVTKDDGSPYHGVGVLPKPEHAVSPSLQGLREGKDEQLLRAIEVARELVRAKP